MRGKVCFEPGSRAGGTSVVKPKGGTNEATGDAKDIGVRQKSGEAGRRNAAGVVIRFRVCLGVGLFGVAG